MFISAAKPAEAKLRFFILLLCLAAYIKVGAYPQLGLTFTNMSSLET